MTDLNLMSIVQSLLNILSCKIVFNLLSWFIQRNIFRSFITNQEKLFYIQYMQHTEKADSCKKWAVTASSILQDSLVVDC
jgi:hypothetical protein